MKKNLFPSFVLVILIFSFFGVAQKVYAATLTVTGTTSNSVTLKADDLPSQVQNYRVNIWTTGEVFQFGWDLNNVSLSTTTTSPSTNPLSPGTYIARLSSQTPLAIIATSAPFTITPSAPAPYLELSELTSTSANIDGVNLIPNMQYVFILSEFATNVALPSQYYIANAQGEAYAFYSNLPVNATYRIKIYNPNLVMVAPEHIFTTSNLTFANISSSSVTLNATGLFPNELYRFYVTDASETDLTYSEFEEVNTGAGTTAEATFSNLPPTTGYTEYIGELSYDSTTVMIVNFTIPGGPAGPPPPPPPPAPVQTPSNLVPCGTLKDATGKITNMCKFNDFIKLVNNVVNFVLFYLALPLAAIMFCYAGFLMVTSGGSTERVSKARKIFTNVALGLALAAASWLIIKVILTTLGYDGSWIGF